MMDQDCRSAFAAPQSGYQLLMLAAVHWRQSEGARWLRHGL